MPVIEFPVEEINNLFPDYDLNYIVTMLPFIGLDIEYMDDKYIRLEYSPNRPDFSTFYGISRAVKGLLEIETGVPKFLIIENKKNLINVDKSISKVRPFISAIVAKGFKLDDKIIKQIVLMQEDLHNGIGGRRLKASIGFHNLDNIQFPLDYTTSSDNRSFIPLDHDTPLTLNEIIDKTEPGKKFGQLLKIPIYPILKDSRGNIISFPPIINSKLTLINEETNNLFVEVTGIDKKVVDTILANIIATLAEIGFNLESVLIKHDGYISSDSIKDRILENVKIDYINKILGLALSSTEIINCLKKSRLDTNVIDDGTINCIIPSYRTDIFSSIDIVEEVAIGYGIYNLEPTLPEFTLYGNKSRQNYFFDKIRQVLVGMGLIENINFILSNKDNQYKKMNIDKVDFFTVNNSKSNEHDVIRKSLLPSLLFSLSKNVHEEYPQKLFEIGNVFVNEKNNSEKWNLCCVCCYNGVTYSEIKIILQTLMKICFGIEFETPPSEDLSFIKGRYADIVFKGKTIGGIGEILPLIIDNFKIRIPVAAFELDLTKLLLV